jgi:hypothetical protein
VQGDLGNSSPGAPPPPPPPPADQPTDPDQQ